MKSNLTCTDCERELIAYRDGALSPAVGRVVEQHVAGCARCRVILEDYSWIGHRIATLPELTPPAWLEDRVLRRTLGPRYALRGWRGAGALAGALAFAASVGLVANLPEIASRLGLGDPTTWPLSVLRGAVNAPTGVAYVAGADIDYYVRAAGGETTKGDFGRAYVTQPGGKLESKHRSHLFWTSKPKPQPGGAVFVPDKDLNQRRDWGQILTAVTSIVGSIVTIAVVLKK